MSTTALPAARRRRPGLWVAVAILTAAVFVLPVGARLWLKADLQQGPPSVIEYQRPIGMLQVNAPGGYVTIGPGPPGQVRVVSSLTWQFAKPVITPVWLGKTLAVTARCPHPDLFQDCQATLTIQVPAGTRVQAQVGAGRVDVTGLTGPVRLAATSGAIGLTDVSGPVSAQATSGTISASSGLASARFQAAVAAGSLTVSFTVAPKQLTLAVGGGAGTVTLPPDTHYRLAVHRGHGLGVLAVAPGLSSSRSPDSIAATLGTGVLNIGYPPGSP